MGFGSLVLNRAERLSLSGEWIGHFIGKRELATSVLLCKALRVHKGKSEVTKVYYMATLLKLHMDARHINSFKIIWIDTNLGTKHFAYLRTKLGKATITSRRRSITSRRRLIINLLDA